MNQLPTRSESNLEDEMETTNTNNPGNQTPELSDSVTAINLSGILNKIIQDLQAQPNTAPTLTAILTRWEKESQLFIEAKGKRLKSALIIIAKASHHKAFMEACLTRNTAPRNMALWVQPHIYHSNPQIERQWRDTLHRASLDLTRTLTQH